MNGVCQCGLDLSRAVLFARGILGRALREIFSEIFSGALRGILGGSYRSKGWRGSCGSYGSCAVCKAREILSRFYGARKAREILGKILHGLGARGILSQISRQILRRSCVSKDARNV